MYLYFMYKKYFKTSNFPSKMVLENVLEDATRDSIILNKNYGWKYLLLLPLQFRSAKGHLLYPRVY